jgi:hypothetical protein
MSNVSSLFLGFPIKCYHTSFWVLHGEQGRQVRKKGNGDFSLRMKKKSDIGIKWLKTIEILMCFRYI